MKALAVGILVFASCAFQAVAQDTNKLPTINVTATAEVTVQPDEVVFSLDVTKRNKDMQAAKREADAALANIIALSRRFAIEPENVRTDHISVEMKYKSIRDPKNRVFDDDGDEIGTRVFLGYDVSTTVVVKMKDLKRFEEFFSEVTKTGVTEINSVTFESSDIVAQTKAVRILAMKAALEKATAMASAINQTVGKAVSISEGSAKPSYFGTGLVANTSNVVSGPAIVSESVATFSPGGIKISSEVSVTFLLN